MSDFQISDHGSIISIKPVSAAARTWVEDLACPGPPTKVVRLPVPIAEFARKLASQQKPGDVVVFDLESRSVLRVPMMAWSVACGFPSLTEDYVDKPLDFNELLIEHPAAIFAIRIEGDSMTGAGIFPGDIAVVDRAREPVNGSIVLALLDGAFTNQFVTQCSKVSSGQ